MSFILPLLKVLNNSLNALAQYLKKYANWNGSALVSCAWAVQCVALWVVNAKARADVSFPHWFAGIFNKYICSAQSWCNNLRSEAISHNVTFFQFSFLKQTVRSGDLTEIIGEERDFRMWEFEMLNNLSYWLLAEDHCILYFYTFYFKNGNVNWHQLVNYNLCSTVIYMILMGKAWTVWRLYSPYLLVITVEN